MAEGVVWAVDGAGVLLDVEGREVFVAASDLPAPAAYGDRLTLQIETITEGTCTPEIVTVMAAE